jgi:N-methylhydantoinase A/oxoprolinase/acetone carboxylase beta subunit
MAVTIKVIGRCRTEPPALPGAGVPAARGKDLSARVWQEGGWAECRVAHRSSIIPGERLEGPVVIPEEGSTTWVPRGWRADALPDASLLMEPSS